MFKALFPMPPAQLFKGFQVSDIVRKRSDEINSTMEKIDLEKIEPLILKIQRRVRMKRRHQEELNRIALRDKEYLDSAGMSPAALLKDASTPYKPKCAATLSVLIMSATKQVSAFSTVKHITSRNAITGIFDDALYGRRTLIAHHVPFTPTALCECDIRNGDGNVVCFGRDIDPTVDGNIIIEFDVLNLIKNNPSAFYKQRDLEYGVGRKREVPLGNKILCFDHTGSVWPADSARTYLKIVNQSPHDSSEYVASAPKSSFISYNLAYMHQILTLNFFRLMDGMRELSHGGGIASAYIGNFYKEVSQLTEEELVAFLTALAIQMTDTAEFNYYGAYRIDFSTVVSITARYEDYTLNLLTFIGELARGNVDALRHARRKIPELFKSYRFLDYLLGSIQHLEARYYLDGLRGQCSTPAWVRHTPLLIPDGLNFRWETGVGNRFFKGSGSVSTDLYLIETIKEAFSDLCSKDNFEATSFCFTSKNIIVALKKESKLVFSASSINALQKLGKLTKEELDMIIKTTVPDNMQLRNNIVRLYNKSKISEECMHPRSDSTPTTRTSQKYALIPRHSVVVQPQMGLFATRRRSLQNPIQTQTLQLPIRSKL